MSLTLAQAEAILTGAFAEARARGLKPLAVCVVDAGARIVAFAREDGASPGRFEVAHGKAHGAAMMGMGSRRLMERAERQAYFVSAVGAAFGGALVPVPGGVLIRNESGAILGAVGVTGDTGDADEAAAMAGIAAAGLAGDPG